MSFQVKLGREKSTARKVMDRVGPGLLAPFGANVSTSGLSETKGEEGEQSWVEGCDSHY